MSDKFGTTGSKRWSDLDYQKYNNAGRAMAKKWSQRWEKYPAWEDIKPINR